MNKNSRRLWQKESERKANKMKKKFGIKSRSATGINMKWEK
jgi:hypothetical protein